MSKRIIGLILAIAALVVILVAAIRYNSYTSIIEMDRTEIPAPVVNTKPTTSSVVEEIAPQLADSLPVTTQDSERK